jgi:hypothetical protein
MKTRNELMSALAESTGLDFDGGDDDRLFAETMYVDLTHMREDDYAQWERSLDEATVEGHMFRVYVWNDVSGYAYWKREGTNYQQVTVHVKNVRKVDPDEIRKAVSNVIARIQHWSMQ